MIPHCKMNHYLDKVFGEDWRFFDAETDVDANEPMDVD